MIDWYYHDPGAGRVGPFAADELRKRFQELRIRHDTLVWHHGLREWQPLQCMAEELGLDQVQPDASQPPPLTSAALAALPPPVPARASASTANRTAARGKYSRTPLRDKKKLSNGAIVAIVSALLGIPLLLIFVSVVIPGYREEVRRNIAMPTVTGLGNALQPIVTQHFMATGRCPSNLTDKFSVLIRRATEFKYMRALRFMTMPDSSCGFEVTLRNLGPAADGKTILFESFMDGKEMAWDCTGGTLPEAYRPWECRASSYDE